LQVHGLRSQNEQANGTETCCLEAFSANDLHQLSREDEEAVGDEIEVRREDQDKINKFSRLHQHELLIKEELKIKTVGASLAQPQLAALIYFEEGERRAGRYHH